MTAHRSGADLLLAANAGYLTLPDPGDAGTIKPDKNPCWCNLKSGASGETRTLSDPDSEAQVLVLSMLTDGGGDITITSSSAINQAGSTSIVFSDVGEVLVLVAIEDSAASYEWRIVASDGVSLPAFLNLPMGAWQEQDGTALADFSDGASALPGWSAGDEGFGIRWNNHANPDPISTSVPYPPDLDPSVDVTVHVLAAKVGATVGDAVTWTIEAFENKPAALYDADTDFGGASSAMTGDAATKTCQEETLTLANANITGAPGVLTLTLQPTDGTLGTDDVIVLGVWLEYTKKSI